MEPTIETKDAGSNLTRIAEYTETAAALADLRQRHQGVVYDVTIPKEMKKAKEARAEVKGYRVALEKRRVEIKAPALERCRLIDSEAKRITEELVALEEPLDVQIKTEEARAEEARLANLEAERLRVEAINKRIDEIRNLPASLVGKPAVIIQGKLERLRADVLSEDEFAEHYLTARDAHDACVARVEQLLQAQVEAEAEKRRQVERDAEMEAMRAKLAEQQRLIDEAEEAKRVEQARLEQVERDRVAQQQRIRETRLAKIERIRNPLAYPDAVLASADLHAAIERGQELARTNFTEANWGDLLDEVESAWSEAHDVLSGALHAAVAREQAEADAIAEREAEDRRLQVERDRQAAEQKKLDEQAAKLKREKADAARKAREQELANVTLLDAAGGALALLLRIAPEADETEKLGHALAREVKPARVKKVAQV